MGEEMQKNFYSDTLALSGVAVKSYQRKVIREIAPYFDTRREFPV